jgi:hypothetical protein
MKIKIKLSIKKDGRRKNISKAPQEVEKLNDFPLFILTWLKLGGVIKHDYTQ